MRAALRADPRRAAVAEFAADVRAGLDRPRKSLPSKYLYDAVGSALFEVITELPEYGLTRAEERILRRRAAEIVRHVPRGVALAELGAGSGRKTVPILDAIQARQRAASYAAVDLSPTAHERCAQLFAHRPGVRFEPIEASYLEGLARVQATRPPDVPLLLLFLGSTIGNLDERERRSFLREVRTMLRDGDALLLGADLLKPVAQTLVAYDDPLGVTAAFDLNMLARINRELGGNFDLRAFRHEARWAERPQRVEMHLRSVRQQVVTVGDADLHVALASGETIWTESSHKFTTASLADLAASAGFTCVGAWVDEIWPFADVLWRVGA